MMLKTFVLGFSIAFTTLTSNLQGVEGYYRSYGSEQFRYEYKVLERLINLEVQLNAFEENLKLSKYVVATQVGLLDNIAVVDGEAIKYDRVVLNIGDGYKPASGEFVVPVSGVYIFTVMVCVNNGAQWMQTRMFQNGVEIGFFMTGDTIWETCNNNVATVVAKEGDRVWVEKVKGAATHLIEKFGANKFTANLIQAFGDGEHTLAHLSQGEAELTQAD